MFITEIVARRCFMTFIYDQLELHLKPETAKDSVFEKPLDGNHIYRLKDNIQVHLYINTGRIFFFNDFLFGFLISYICLC